MRVEIHNVLLLARKWLWLLVLAALIGGVAGLVVDHLQPKQYQADATLFVSSPNHSDYNFVLGDQQAAAAVAQYAKSYSVLIATLQKVGGSRLSLIKLTKMVTVENSLNSQFVTIKVLDTDPSWAALLASNIARETMTQFEATVTDSNLAQTLRAEITNLAQQVKEQEKELSVLQSQVAALKIVGTPTPAQANTINKFNQLNANLNELRHLYTEDVNSYTTLTSIQLTLVEDAQVPQNPVGPGVSLAIAIGMLAGLIAIVGIIVFIEQTDNVLRTPAKVAKATGLPTFIAVKHLPEITRQTPWLNGYRPGAEVTVTVKPVTALVERASSLESKYGVTEETAKRLAVRTQQAPHTANRPLTNRALRRLALSDPFLTLGVLLSRESNQEDSSASYRRSLLITSPENGDGKTLIASQTALGLARIGIKVVLVDANLRHPRIHKIFGISNQTGLSTVLSTDNIMDVTEQLVDTIQQTPEPNLTILPAGYPIDSPPTLLSSSRMDDILQELSQIAFVVIDSPAVLTASETMILASKSDGILMVVNARHTTAAKLNQSLEMLSRIHVHIHGIVLNQVGKQNEV